MNLLFKNSVITALVAIPLISQAVPLEVTATNRLPLARANQTIEISATDLAPLEAKTLNLVHVKDSTGKELVCQALDTNGDVLRDFDAVIFQADFAAGETKTFTVAAGLKKIAGKTVAADAAQGWFAKWEKMEKNAGHQGLAVIASPGRFDKHVEDPLNQFVLFKPDSTHVTKYWAGFCWDKAGRFTDAAAWIRHVGEFAQGLASPLEIQTTLLK